VPSSPPSQGKPSPDLFNALRATRRVQNFAAGSTLFCQGSAVRGVYLVEGGEVRVLLTAGQSRRQLLEVAGPGDILGLSESMCGETYRITAEANADTSVVFIPRQELVAFLRENVDFCLQVVRILSEDLHGLYHKFRSITAHPGRPRQRALEEQLN
jgi:CRP/FNR family transcriptional regulator, polysaccharide utilization system transcription regulator